MDEGKTMFSIGDLALEEVFEGELGKQRLWGGKEQERSRERGCNEEQEIFWRGDWADSSEDSRAFALCPK